MSLTLGGGPLAGNAPSTVNYRIDGPAHKLFFRPFPRRVRGVLNGETVVDTERGMLLYESNLMPVLYVPEEDLRTDLLTATDHSTHCPFKGDASYRTITAGDRVEENAVWHYPAPIETAPWLKGYAALYWDKIDQWFDEDEEVLGHLRDPYHRVDIRTSSRKVVVRNGDAVLAESSRPFVVSETGLPNRYYLPREDVRNDVLTSTKTSSVCPYKGIASYVRTADIDDVAWIYEEPLAESLPLAGAVAFDTSKVTVEVDGVKVS